MILKFVSHYFGFVFFKNVFTLNYIFVYALKVKYKIGMSAKIGCVIGKWDRGVQGARVGSHI